jgi:two-component system sensor histidine kinase KdpD
MQRYVEKLLDMTRLDAGGIEARIEGLDPADVLAAVAARARTLDEQRIIRLNVEPDLPMVQADAALLDQALFNLIENATTHAASGEIVVGAARSRGGVVFTVADEGPGLTPGDEARIFERFERADNSASGTGLGLAIVKGFVSLMGAKVSARNRSDRSGAVFTIEFPAERLA